MAKNRPSTKNIIPVISHAAKKAGSLILKLQRQGKSQDIRLNKADGTYSLVADVSAEQCILDYLRKHMPVAYTVLAEESGGRQQKDILTVIIDPIDGTYNYSRGMHDFVISIGIAKNGIPIGGVIYAPRYDQMLSAWKGKGAYCNGKKMVFSTRWSYTRIIIDGLAKEFPQGLLDRINRTCKWIRIESAASAMAHVATSRMDGCLLIGAYAWDYCAGIIILQEAGALVVDHKGKKPTIRSKIIIAGNKKTVRHLRSLLNDRKTPAKEAKT